MSAQANDPGAGDAGAAPSAPRTAAPTEPRTNLPVRTAPVVGRKREMQAIAEAFEKSRRAGRPGRVEVTGRLGVGATTVAVELARRAGIRFPGGAWFVDAAMGADLGWAEVAVARGRGRTKDLAATVASERERIAAGPQCVVVIDGVADAQSLLAALPNESRTPPYVFAVAPKRTGVTDDVVEVSDVPPQGARRICRTILNGAENAPPEPPVRVLDGLAVTTSIAARAAMAWQGKHGPMLIEDTLAAIQRFVPILAQSPITLEMLLVASVLHPSRIPVDTLYSAVESVRKGRGESPKPEEVGNGVLMLAKAGLLDPCDDRRVNIHPIVQESVRRMVQSDQDLVIARQAATEGLVAEAEGAVGEDGLVDLTTCGLHQIRHLAADDALGDDARAKLADARAKLEKALGIAA
ncbi:MAG: hypothetical protein HMLKMBBP_03752 [Planctomycetes bacterium]|nr:hypothetical protein [Planctomycetota bacterium]